MQAPPTIHPVDSNLLPKFCSFLHQNLYRERSVSAWQQALSESWCEERPNYGYVLVNEEHEIVGGIGALYADREIGGKKVKICNITSWCVLEAFRMQSMRLAMALISQPGGYHYTDFSPTSTVGSVLQFLKFKPLDERVTVLANLPWWQPATQVLGKPDDLSKNLTIENLRVYNDHKKYSWLHFLLLQNDNRQCLVIYKIEKFKGCPAIKVIYLSDSLVFSNRFRSLGSWWLFQHTALSTHVETRLLSKDYRLSAIREGFVNKVFLSNDLEAEDIDYLYSESVVMNL